MINLSSRWRVIFLILYVNCAEYVAWSAQRRFFENSFNKIDQEQTIIGDSESTYKTEIMEECMIRCSQDPECKAYQYRDNEPYNCILILGTMNETFGQTYRSDDHNTVYKKNFCFPNPCSKSKPRCINEDDSYSCECTLGWFGENCDAKDHCYPNPCKHDAECTPGLDDYICDCPAGFTGKQCEVNIDDCPLVNPCENGGRCVDLINGYECQCETGYNGTLCETDIDECSSAPCLNGGTCEDSAGYFLCTCVAGFEGDSCENEINECAENPCLNGGCCLDGLNFYICICRPGFHGSNCENNINDCAEDPCLSGGLCLDGVNNYTCNCTTGFNGSICENNIDDCPRNNPCLNGGSCVDGVNTFNCSCAPGYNGDHCQTGISLCASNPCQNGGSCIDEFDVYFCDCVNGFAGASCQLYCDVEWCAPSGWTGAQPVEYLSFDMWDTRIYYREGATTTTGLIIEGAQTVKAESQWVDIDRLTTCIIADPDSCGSTGATVTAWIKISDCTGSNGIISSQTGFTASKGFIIACLNDRMRYAVYGASGHFMFTTNTNQYTLNDWMHVALVFNGPANGEGISVYQNGIHVGDTTAFSGFGSATAPSGAVIIGRELDSQNYASVIVDDLVFWEEKLQQQQIQDIFDMHNPNP